MCLNSKNILISRRSTQMNCRFTQIIKYQRIRICVICVKISENQREIFVLLLVLIGRLGEWTM